MVISVADAYRIDPATGQVDMDLFQQFANQQAVANQTVNPNSPTFNNSLALSAGQNYLAANPDVLANAQQRAQAEGLSSGDAYSNRLNEIAQEHYNAYGQNEGRAGFGNPARERTNTTGTNINPGTEYRTQPFPPSGQTGLGSMPGGNNQSQQPNFDNSAYQNALSNFGGLLDNYGSFFGGLLSGAQNNQANMSPYSAYPNANYVNPWNSTAPVGANSVFGSGNRIGNMAGSMASGGWNSGSSWSGGGGAANTGHNMLWTT